MSESLRALSSGACDIGTSDVFFWYFVFTKTPFLPLSIVPITDTPLILFRISIDLFPLLNDYARQAYLKAGYSLDEKIDEDGRSVYDVVEDENLHTPDEDLYTNEVMKNREEFILSLTPKQQELVRAILDGGQNIAQVAKKLGISRQNATQMLKRIEAARMKWNKAEKPLWQELGMRDERGEMREKTNELLLWSLASGLRFDPRSITAVRQSLNNISSLPEKVKENLLTAFDLATKGGFLDGLKRPLDPKGFVTLMTKLGFKREGSSSAYMTVNGYNIRLSYHDASASTFKRHGVTDKIVSISIRKENNIGKEFKPDKEGKTIWNYYFAGKIKIGGNDKIIFVRTRESEGRMNRFYVHEVFTEDETKELGNRQTDAASNDLDRKYRNASEFYRNIVAKVMNVNLDFEKVEKKQWDLWAEWGAFCGFI